ncbi:uncharacterized protein LAESUDRAFT_719806 [Laetiporus sulphureus 93-53]|uniref:SH3 domain-containing protein n=1 Tax=Laetiporus sulphureus 93-53 TaxID=1314785 RepID=A0A165HKX7_9APHY|nr:uncharacterized protein LAESUDRAFT_719806 [Laetiporus sulphureus 93-53]KZT11864.1 hypothetical protein LAESUDRAFT_719806 [Laetiporus sulphureus 93-53]
MSSASNFIAGASAVSSQATLTSTYSPYSSAGSVSGSRPGPGHSSSGGEPSSSSSGPTSSNHQLSALATLGFIPLFVLAFLLLRRRGIAQRLEKRRPWLFGRDTGAYGNAAVDSSRYFHDHPGASVSPSRRSSFGTGTALDAGISSEQWETFPTLSSETNSRSALPSITVPRPSRHVEVVPEVGEVCPSSLNGSIAEPALVATVHSDPLPIIRSSERDSWENERAQSEAGSLVWEEWPTVPDNSVMNQRSPTLPTPISARPLASSQKCIFPTPLQDHKPKSVKSVQSTRESINANSKYMTALENPFSDLASVGMGLGAETSTEDGSDAQTADSFSTADPETASHFARVETIRRPFVPTMDDEMSVLPGETVRILLRYDDGWAYAEKLGSGRRGLIPIDCLRMPEEDLSAFLASKRLNSYSVTDSLKGIPKDVEIDARTTIGKAL